MEFCKNLTSENSLEIQRRKNFTSRTDVKICPDSTKTLLVNELYMPNRAYKADAFVRFAQKRADRGI